MSATDEKNEVAFIEDGLFNHFPAGGVKGNFDAPFFDVKKLLGGIDFILYILSVNMIFYLFAGGVFNETEL